MQQSHNLENPSGQEQIVTKPQAMPVDLVMIPPALKAIARWVVWRYVGDVDRNTGEISWDKPPPMPVTAVWPAAPIQHPGVHFKMLPMLTSRANGTELVLF